MHKSPIIPTASGLYEIPAISIYIYINIYIHSIRETKTDDYLKSICGLDIHTQHIYTTFAGPIQPTRAKTKAQRLCRDAVYTCIYIYRERESKPRAVPGPSAVGRFGGGICGHQRHTHYNVSVCIYIYIYIAYTIRVCRLSRYGQSAAHRRLHHALDASHHMCVCVCALALCVHTSMHSIDYI